MLFYAFSSDYDVIDDDSKACLQIDYPLNSSYSKLTGNIVLPEKIDIAGLKKDDADNDNRTATVFFYGDGKLIHTATDVTTTMPFSLNLDVSDVDTLTIKIKVNIYYNAGYVALTDLALYE